MKIGKVIATAMLMGAGVGSLLRAQDDRLTTRPTTTSQPAATSRPASTQPGVTLINLHLKDAQPQDVLTELSKQSGVQLRAAERFGQNGQQNEPGDSFDIDLENRPFWSALNEVCDSFDLTVQPGMAYANYSGNNRSLLLMHIANRDRSAKPPTWTQDGFVVQATSINRSQSVDLSNARPPTDFCSLQLTAYVDPALHVQSFSPTAKAEVAIDDADHSLIPDATGGSVSYGSQRSSLIYNCSVPLKFPKNPGKKIVDLKCTLQLRASTSVERFVVEKPLTADETSKEFGATTVTFTSLKRLDNGSYQLKLGMTQDYEAENGFEQGTLLQTAQLLDSEGHEYMRTRWMSSGADENGVHNYTAEFSTNRPGFQGLALGAPAKWVLEVPSKSRVIKLPVEFKDLLLPQP